MTPVILVTLYRRYHELQENLRHIHSVLDVFPEKPRIVLVWAAPEVGRLWLIQSLLTQGLVDKVIGRPLVDGDGNVANTTYPESLNIRLGLDGVLADSSADYAIVQAADIKPSALAYRYIRDHMDGGGRVVGFHWPSAVARGCLHTNFFAVTLDRSLWPPVVDRDNADVLEKLWRDVLSHTEGVLRISNANGSMFYHRHTSESAPPTLILPQSFEGGVSAFVAGRRMPLWRRLLNWLIDFIFKE